MSKKILVLGATGTVGAHLAELLVQGGHDVRSATRSPDAFEGAGVATRVDVSDPATYGPALEGVERLFVLSPPGHADQHALLEPFLRAAFASPTLERIVTMTAQGIDASDEIPFRKLELLIEGSGTHFVHLRPTWFSQNFHTFWGHGVRGHRAITLPAEDARVAFIDARDIASSANAALTRDDIELDSAWELTGPEALTHAEAAAVLSEAVGETITYHSISEDAFRDQLAPSGLPSDYIDLLVGLFVGVRAGGASSVTDAVERLTGSKPLALGRYAVDHVDQLS